MAALEESLAAIQEREPLAAGFEARRGEGRRRQAAQADHRRQVRLRLQGLEDQIEIAKQGQSREARQPSGHRLELTNLDKVLWPKTASPKDQVIDYYARVADAILPHLRDRPLTLKQ